MDNLLSGLFGSLITAAITIGLTRYYIRYEQNRQIKLDTLTQLIWYRHILSNDQFDSSLFLSAINKIFVTFQDSREVIDSLNQYNEDGSDKNLINLITIICNDVWYKIDERNKSFILKPFIKK